MSTGCDRIGMPVQIVLTAAAIAALALPVLAQSGGGIAGVLAPGVVPEHVQEGFVFTEGPVGTADGGLYFSDISKTHYLDPGGKISVFREGTNGSNGLALNKDGELLFAEGDGKRISKRNKDGSIATLTEGPPGAPLLAPNDLIVDNKGGIYFTDPGPRPVVPGRSTYVYYLPSGAKIPVLIDGMVARPNGLTLTTDGKTRGSRPGGPP
jgi:gluconolactonase